MSCAENVEAEITRPDMVAVGYSRGSSLVHYAITHPSRTAFSAAAVNDYTTQSYQEYLHSTAVSGQDSEAMTYAVVNRNPWQGPLYRLRKT